MVGDTGDAWLGDRRDAAADAGVLVIGVLCCSFGVGPGDTARLRLTDTDRLTEVFRVLSKAPAYSA